VAPRLFVAATLGLLLVSPAPSLAQSPGDGPREVTALKRDVDRLRTELTGMKKQIDELKKIQSDMNAHVETLRTHRHQLFLDFLRADAFFPQAKGTFFVTTPSPDTLTKTSGPIAGQK
jgi:hypothetical protein